MRPLHMAVAILVLFAGCGREEVQQAPSPAIGTEVGNRAPDLAGTLADGSSFVLGSSPSAHTVLIFYRSAQCGLCRLQLEQVQRHLPGYEYEDAAVVGVTLDAPEMSRALREEVGIDFDLVSVDAAVFGAWGVAPTGSDPPLPATFIIDADRIVRFQHIGRNAADRTSDAGLLTILQTLNG